MGSPKLREFTGRHGETEEIQNKYRVTIEATVTSGCVRDDT
jgi:hypothetical protein